MKNLALLLSFLGMFILFCLLLSPDYISISNETDISVMHENEKVHFAGKVAKVSSLNGEYFVVLDNSISFVSDISVRQEENVSVQAIIEKYYDKKRIRATSIEK